MTGVNDIDNQPVKMISVSLVRTRDTFTTNIKVFTVERVAGSKDVNTLYKHNALLAAGGASAELYNSYNRLFIQSLLFCETDLIEPAATG